MVSAPPSAVREGVYGMDATRTAPVKAGTGHIIGGVYASHYWGGTYKVLRAVGPRAVTVRWSDGSVTTHCTRLDLDPIGHPGRDHLVSERCGYRVACRSAR